jgi:RsiW-degrading membrane proteinase PrsW (M82 family)
VSSTAFAIAFLGGLIPALFWLWFWLREDRARPEPYLLIAITFIAGMAVVPLALPLQKYACDLLQTGACYPAGENLMTLWVIIEEVLKYAAALIVILWHREVDQPIDMVIYMIVIALGFAALENALFIGKPLGEGATLDAALAGSFRFLGATLLHVLASGTVGMALALAFYRGPLMRLAYATVGLFIAIVLHGLFNFFILDASGETILAVFLFVWMGIIVLFLLFEKVKLLERTPVPNPTNQPMPTP